MRSGETLDDGVGGCIGFCGDGVGGEPGGAGEFFADPEPHVWGDGGQKDAVRAAKLKANMTEIDSATIMQPLTNTVHHFHEGSAMVKRAGCIRCI